MCIRDRPSCFTYLRSNDCNFWDTVENELSGGCKIRPKIYWHIWSEGYSTRLVPFCCARLTIVRIFKLYLLTYWVMGCWHGYLSGARCHCHSLFLTLTKSGLVLHFTFMVLDYPGSISDHLLMCTEEEIMIKISQENDCCKLANENFGYYCNRLICCQCTVTSTWMCCAFVIVV